MSDTEPDKTDKGERSSGDEKSEKSKERTPRQKRRDRKKQRRKQAKQNPKTTFQGGTAEIQSHVFVLDPKIKSKMWLRSREAFIDYAGTKYGGDVKSSLTTLEEKVVTVDEPTKYTNADFQTLQKEKAYEYEIWKFETKEYREATKRLKLNLSQLYSVLWGQCDTAMRNKIKTSPDYHNANARNNVIALLEIIDKICSTGEESNYRPLEQYLSLKRLIMFRQADDVPIADYFQEFELLVKVAEKTGVRFWNDSMLQHVQTTFEVFSEIENVAYDDLDPDDQLEVQEAANDAILAVMFVMNANDKYKLYKQDCHNSYVNGKNDYPITLIDAYTALDQYRMDLSIYQKTKDTVVTPTVSHSFLTDGAQDSDERCYNCGRRGHYSRDCTYRLREDGTPTKKAQECNIKGQTTETNIQENNLFTHGDYLSEEYEDDLSDSDYKVQIVDGYSYLQDKDQKNIVIADMREDKKHVFNQADKRLNPKWILLDNCSTVNVFYNPDFLTDIKEVDDELHLYTNAGKAIINQQGTLPGIGTVWFHPEGIANILGYHGLASMEGVHIEYNNKHGEDVFKVHGPTGVTIPFIPSKKGLYYWEAQECKQDIFSHKEAANFVETVAENKKKFAKRDVLRAERARKFQQTAGHISDTQLMRIATKNQLLNCPITPKDVRLMQAIFGPNVPGLKGKTTRKRKDGITPHIIPLPQTVKDHYRKVTLGIDIMFVNKIPFLVTISRDIHYGTATPLKSSKTEDITSVLRQLTSFYRLRGFRVRTIMADGQFKSLSNEIAKEGIKVNCVSADEHVPEVERYIRTIKERCRCIYHDTPFKKIPKRMTTELVRTATYYLNAFPWAEGISQTLAPVTIITGIAPDYNLHFKVKYGTYAQIREATTNTLKGRTIGAIATAPANNVQGGMRFFSLRTGQLQDRAENDYHVCPMPDEVIERVHHMSRRNQDGIQFQDRNQNDIDSDEEDSPSDSDSDYEPEEEGTTSDDSSTRSEDVESTGVDSEDDEDDSRITEDEEQEEREQAAEDDNRETEQEIRTSSFGRRINPGTSLRPMDDEFEYQYTQYRQSIGKVSLLDTPEEAMNLTNAIENWQKQRLGTVNEFILTQYSLKAGLRKFGEDGKQATMKELNQMLKREVFVEIPYHELTSEDKERSLPILLFLTMKRDGSIKGRACADGRKQRVWMHKEDSSSPTIAPEALFYTLVVDAFEGRDVATCDLPGHFLQTDMDERLILRIDGPLARLLTKINPDKWKKHLRKEKGRDVIYVRCNKAIYGTLNAALLSYKKLIGHLREWGFEMNPYEPCCWNKMIKGKQMTIVFHVDDLKLSHIDPAEVTAVIQLLESIYATIDPMSKTRGKVHQYLGMTIDFRQKGEVKISMYDYIKKMIDMLPNDMIGTKPTAAPEHLFKTDGPRDSLLSKERSDTFHSLTAMSLYLGKRARPDLQTPIAFLTTRVQEPDEHDWKKLAHAMKYLQSTRHLPLILRADGCGTSIYIDGAHAVHADMKGHAGAMTTEGIGAVFASSTKNKINTLSSTETEVVATGEKLPKFVWYRNFRLSQGCNSREDVLYQDNKSAILLNKNGRMSCGKGSKHIGIRYFFITDRIARGEFKVEYCPTGDMLADYFTKPLQGSLFRRMRDAILGIKEEDFDKYKSSYQETLKEFGLIDNE